MISAWALILVITMLDGSAQVHVLNTFAATHYDDPQMMCYLEKVRITRDMRDSYPNDNDYEILCRPIRSTTKGGET